jgi:hypothetical protein
MNPAHTQDELVESLLDEALEDYEGLVPAEVLAEIRETLGDLLYAHPDGQRILRQLEVDPLLGGSGDVVRPGPDGETPAKEEQAPRKVRG